MNRILRHIQVSGVQVSVLVAIILVVILSIQVMRVIADIRFRELKTLLQNVSAERASGASLSLIARYQFVQHRFESAAEKGDDYLVEGELMAAASAELTQRELSEQKRNWFERFVVALMNLAGKLTQTKPIADLDEDQGQKILEVAFFYERRRDFEKAIGAYNAALGSYAQRKDMLAYIFLHRGFCYSNIGKRGEALADYRQVKAYDTARGELSTTAEVLALFLLDINKRLSLVEKMSDSVEKGELLYLLMAYNRAIETLSVAVARTPSQKAYFFRGRSYEETGKAANAIADYRRLIGMNRQSEWAAKANRRLYILGTFYEADSGLAEESQKLARVVGDEKFINDSQVYAQTTDAQKIARLGDDKLFAETLTIIEERNQAGTGKIKLIDPESKQEVEWTEESLGSKRTNLDLLIDRVGAAQHGERLRRILLNPKTTRQNRKAIFLRNFKSLVKIQAHDGNEFVGIIDGEDGESLELITVLGLVRLPKNVISRRDMVDSEKAFE